MGKSISIAIDGPVAAGKTTQAKLLAKTLGFLYVDTGALYRTIACYMQMNQKDPDDIMEVLNCIDMNLDRGEDGEQHMFLGSEDITDRLRTPDISKLASDISALPCVRDFLLNKQREAAMNNDVVMEGRDIGTVILPDADVKVFLTAEPETRAQRRWLELSQKGSPCPLSKVLCDLQQRDYNDSHRAVAPLKQAEDAVLVDCTHLNIQETTQKILEIVSSKVIRPTKQKEMLSMKETGIIRRIDDLGRIVIPKEIRRNLRIREGDPLELYLYEDGVVFRPYNIGRHLEKDIREVMNAIRFTTGAPFKLVDSHGRSEEGPQCPISQEEVSAVELFMSLYVPTLNDTKNSQLLFRIMDHGESAMCLFTPYKEGDDVSALMVAGNMAAKLLEAKINA